MLIALVSLLLIPMVAFRIGGRRWPAHRWLVTGAAFGAVASPASLGLYALFAVPYVGIVPGLIGLPLSLVHGTPGFQFATVLGLRDAGTVVYGVQHVTIEFLNGLFWMAFYGAGGHLLDRFRARRRSADSRS